MWFWLRLTTISSTRYANQKNANHFSVTPSERPLSGPQTYCWSSVASISFPSALTTIRWASALRVLISKYSLSLFSAGAGCLKFELCFNHIVARLGFVKEYLEILYFTLTDVSNFFSHLLYSCVCHF
jgi:hypothetical protein